MSDLYPVKAGTQAAARLPQAVKLFYAQRHLELQQWLREIQKIKYHPGIT
jgi:hypothetical protein